MKEHVKLYKAGKLWVSALVASLIVGIGAGTALANDNVVSNSESTTQMTTNNNSSSTLPDSINGYNKRDQNGTVTYQNDSGQNLTGWQKDNDSWYYFNDNGSAHTGWYQSPAGNWYDFKENGQAQSGWYQSQAGAWYYADPTNAWNLTGWQNLNNNWYYFDPTQTWAETGWQWIDNNWYYFDSTNHGQMLTGIQRIDGQTYYLNEQHDGSYGAMKRNWQYVNGHWYDFDNGGAAHEGWLLTPANNWYYFNQQGQAQTSWYQVNGHWYYGDPTNAWTLRGWQLLTDGWHYFDPNQTWLDENWQWLDNSWFYFNPANHGLMLTGFQKINGEHYYLNAQHDGSYGAMKTGWQWISDGWYYFTNSGSQLFSWQNINGSTYYLDPTTGRMANGDTKIDGNHYYFNLSTGAQEKGMLLNPKTSKLDYYDVQSGIRQTSVDGFTFSPVTGDIDTANLADGLNKIDGHIYFYNKNNDRFESNEWKQINNRWYYFDDNGAAQTGWFKSNAGNWYYFNSNGAAQTGWFKSAAGFWYYFDPTNAWATTGWRYINGNWYYFADGYECQHGTGAWVRTDNNYGQMYTGVQWVDGHCYNFGTSGAETAEPWNDWWSWPFPSAGEGYFLPGQAFGYSSYPRKNHYHDGIDFGVSDHPGYEVHAVHGGKVLDVTTCDDDNGQPMWWYVTIWDGKYLYVYQEAFSNRNKIAVSPNDIVYPGQVIGWRDLSHLHLGINTSPNYEMDLNHSFQPSWSDPNAATGSGYWLNPETVIRNHG